MSATSGTAIVSSKATVRATRRVAWLTAGQLAYLVVIWPLLGSVVTLGWYCAGSWLVWGVLQWQLARLVATGQVGHRRQHAPGLINSTNTLVRLFLHLLHNWSAVLACTVAGWSLSVADGGALATAALVGSAVVWCWFNWQHRRFNRLRNIGLTSFLGLLFAIANMVRL